MTRLSEQMDILLIHDIHGFESDRAQKSTESSVISFQPPGVS